MSNLDFLVAPPPKEVPLPNAPLVRVIAQVRFPPIPEIGNRDSIVSFQKGTRSEFPVVRSEQMLSFVASQVGLMAGGAEPVWRFIDLSGAWRVSLASTFLTLETTKYTNRLDFFQKFQTTLEALAQLDVQVIDRLGVRYIDRVVRQELAEIVKLVRSEVSGITGLSLGSNPVQSLSETLFALNGAQLLARWGKLPPNATVDPTAIEPIGEPSWILDMDMFSVSTRSFKSDELVAEALSYSERLYGVFRWVVTDEFLRRYGGKP